MRHLILLTAITAKMQDYLQSRTSGKIVEGSKKFKMAETIWSFTWQNGDWRVSNIEEDSLSLTYASMMKTLPSIESTLLNQDRMQA